MTVRTFTPALRAARDTALAFASERTAATESKPRRASSMTVASPIPVPAPVVRTVRSTAPQPTIPAHEAPGSAGPSRAVCAAQGSCLSRARGATRRRQAGASGPGVPIVGLVSARAARLAASNRLHRLPVGDLPERASLGAHAGRTPTAPGGGPGLARIEGQHGRSQPRRAARQGALAAKAGQRGAGD